MIIESSNLTKRFRGHDAVHGVNLAVPEGAAFALIGANGAGKTTTLRLLVNLLQPDDGSARVLGMDSRALKPRDFLRIGYVSENQELPDGLRVEEFFEYLRALYPNWDGALERELRSDFELPRSQLIGKLSHGGRMKVKLSAALAFRPKLLILDEPLSGLDPLVRDEVMAGVLKQAGETTVVISSHELPEIEHCITHVAFMVKGKTILQEPIEGLTSRFRDVSVTLTDAVDTARLPERWLAPERLGPTLRFVDTAYVDDDELRRALGIQFGTIARFDAQPMSLREISKAMMRATRAESVA